MENFLNAEQQKIFKRAKSNYAKAGLSIKIENGNGKYEFVIRQDTVFNGFILTNKQLYERAKKISDEMGLKANISPVVFKPNFNEVTPQWVFDRMKELDINRNTLLAQTGLDKGTLSLVLNDARSMTRTMKATFYYYFLTYELNAELRN